MAPTAVFMCCARPETVKSRSSREVEERYALKGSSRVLVQAIGHKIGSGAVR